MRIDEQRLLRMALVVLAEAPDRVTAGPLGADPAVRLALAVAFEFSNGDREPFDKFWQQMQYNPAMSTEESMRYCRTTYLQTQLRGVLRAVGHEPNFKIEQALEQAWRRTRLSAPDTENRGRP